MIKLASYLSRVLCKSRLILFRIHGRSVYLYVHSKKRTTCCNIVANRIEQCFTAHIAHSCQQYCSALSQPTQAQQYCFILLTTVKIVFNRVKQQAQTFWLCN